MSEESMTDLNLRVAQILGWTEMREQDFYASPSDPTDIQQFWQGVPPENMGLLEQIPDFVGDLNCCTGFEETLDPAEWDAYAAILMHLATDERGVFSAQRLIQVTAEEKCRAFIAAKSAKISL